MPTYTPYVTIEDLKIYLESLGIGVSLSVLQKRSFERRYNDIVSAACQAWDKATGYNPFVVQWAEQGDPRATTKTPVLTTQQYTSLDNGLLDLGAGMVGQPNAVRQIDQNGAIVQTYTWNPRWSFPLNAPNESKPFTYFKFRDAVNRGGGWCGMLSPENWGLWGTGQYYALEVEGYWGYCLPGEVPALVKEAILSRAGQQSSFASALSAVLAAGGVSDTKQGDVEVKYDTVTLLKAFVSNTGAFESAVPQFRRTRIA